MIVNLGSHLDLAARSPVLHYSEADPHHLIKNIYEKISVP